MMGARQAAGSTISNGGGSSSSNWVIVSAPSLKSAVLEKHFNPESAAFMTALSIIAVAVPSKKTLNHGKHWLAAGFDGEARDQVDSQHDRVQKCCRATALSPEIYSL